jgi:uncharacterized membrane protein YdjX (TVP38/TMEM64 family)
VKQSKNRILVIVFLVIVIAGFILTRNDNGALLQWAVDFIGDPGPASYGLFLGINLVAILLILPVSAMASMLAGFIFGLWPAFVLGVVANGVACVLQWFIGRRLLGEYTDDLFRTYPVLDRLAQGVRTQTFLFILLLRLSPVVPFAVVNLSVGARRLPWRPYFLGSVVSLLPQELAFNYLGSVARSTAELTVIGAGSAFEISSMVLGALATMGLVLWSSMMARRALNEFASSEPALEPASSHRVDD